MQIPSEIIVLCDTLGFRYLVKRQILCSKLLPTTQTQATLEHEQISPNLRY